MSISWAGYGTGPGNLMSLHWLGSQCVEIAVLSGSAAVEVKSHQLLHPVNRWSSLASFGYQVTGPWSGSSEEIGQAGESWYGQRQTRCVPLVGGRAPASTAGCTAALRHRCRFCCPLEVWQLIMASKLRSERKRPDLERQPSVERLRRDPSNRLASVPTRSQLSLVAD